MKKPTLLLLLLLIFSACDKDEKGEASACINLPYCRFMLTDYGSYVEVPHHQALNPTEGMTLEGWVRLDTHTGTNMLIYKRLYYKTEGYYVEVTEEDGKYVLTSYMGYSGSKKKAGELPIHEWMHWAVTTDGITRRHYINGELAGEFPEAVGVFTPSTEALQIAKPMPAYSSLAEFRLWNVARSQEEIKATMNSEITSPMPGLVAVWPFGENANDIIGEHHGIMHNNPTFKTWCCPE